MSSFQRGPFGVPVPGLMPGYRADADSLAQSRFFNAVYAWMAAGLGITALVAWAVFDSPALRGWALNTPVLIVSFILELGLVVVISAAINRISAATATALFMLYAAINGFVLSVLFLIYTHTSLGGTFVVTAGTFGLMSLYGYTTKRDLTGLGSILYMALLGLVLASLVSLFVHATLLYWAITCGGVVIFVGLTAYDTQRLKEIASQTAGNAQLASRLAVVGSLTLYLDFINLFLLLLRVLGNRRN